jgi:hypothetical protein
VTVFGDGVSGDGAGDDGGAMSGMVKARLRVALMLLAGVLAVAGCGSPGSCEDSSTDSLDGAAAGDGASGGGRVAATEQQVDRSFWHSGFKITLGLARLLPPPSGSDGAAPVVTIEATFQNLSREHDARPPDYLLLTSGGHAYNEPSTDHEKRPEVPAQRSQTGMIAIEVDDRFALADAVLTVGEPTERQAVVPLGRAEGLVSLEPRTLAVGGRVTGEGGRKSTFFMTVKGGEVRADDPLLHVQAPTGKEFLMLSFTATNNSAAGMAYVFDRNLTLRLPDGTRVGHAGCSRAQVHAQEYSTVSGGMVCFEIPTPATGEYTLVMDNVESGGLRVPIA